MKHSIQRWLPGADEPTLGYKPVRATKWEPTERKY
jgi:hypothetical protein